MYILNSWSSTEEGHYYAGTTVNDNGKATAHTTTSRVQAIRYSSKSEAQASANKLWGDKLGTFTPIPIGL